VPPWLTQGDKDGELLGKNEIFNFRHWGAIETAHWAYLFAVMNSPCAQLGSLRTASPALSLPSCWKFLTQITQNDEVKFLAGEWNEERDST
jgi:hypothetical protein